MVLSLAGWGSFKSEVSQDKLKTVFLNEVISQPLVTENQDFIRRTPPSGPFRVHVYTIPSALLPASFLFL